MPGPRIVHLALALALAGCTRRGESAAVTPPDAGAPAAKLFDDARVESPIGGAAGTADAPIPRCGARDSYRYVAAEFRCPEGGNPLDGDLSAAARVRAGSIGPRPDGHMIDVYEVPCPSGQVDVFIDMYGCPEMQQQLARDLVAQDPLQLDVHFRAGRYDDVRTRCEALTDDSASMTVYHCGVFTPALLLRAGEPERAVAAAGRTCQGYPPVSGRSGIRVELLVAMVDAIARMWAADKVPLEEGRRRLAEVIPRLLGACGVDAEAFLTAFEAANGD
jgi:hypothetical protein